MLAAEHPLMRRNLRLLLDNEEGVDVIAEADDLAAAERHVHGHLPHVLVLDLGQRNGSSIELVRKLREQVPSTEIVVTTMDASPVSAQKAVDAGAIGFVLKDLADVELPRAVRSAADGEAYFSPHVAERLESLSRSADGGEPKAPLGPNVN